jgi:hypothetical protein
MPGTARLRTHFSFQTQGFLHGTEPCPDTTLAITKGEDGTMTFATGLTDQTIVPSGMTTVTGLELYADQDISVKLGAVGTNVAFSLAAFCPLALLGVSLSAVTVSNASGSTVNVNRRIVGS